MRRSRKGAAHFCFSPVSIHSVFLEHELDESRRRAVLAKLLAEAREWQTLIAGLVGFAGVIWTIRSSSEAARRLDAEKRQAEILIVRTALIEEIRYFKSLFVVVKSDSLPENGGDTLLVPVPSVPSIYRANQSKLGVLSPEEVSAVVIFYAHYEHMERVLNFLGWNRGRDRAPPPSGSVTVPMSKKEALDNLYQLTEDKADLAIAAMEAAINAAARR